MDDAGIKKLIIPKNQLPPVNDDNEYVLRYRIISDDKNRSSHYSPIFSVPAVNIESVSGTLFKKSLNSFIFIRSLIFHFLPLNLLRRLFYIDNMGTCFQHRVR